MQENVEKEVDKQVQALNKITLALLEQQKKNNKSLLTIIVLLIVCMGSMVGGFFWYESQFEITETVTETTVTDYSTKTVDQSVDGENSEINNVEGNQYKDSSVHNEGVE